MAKEKSIVPGLTDALIEAARREGWNWPTIVLGLHAINIAREDEDADRATPAPIDATLN